MARRSMVMLGAVAIALAVALAVLDTLLEGEGFVTADFALEIVDRAATLGAVAMVAWLTFALREVRADQSRFRREIAQAIDEGSAWRAEYDSALRDLAGAIRRQFEAWSLTPAEADIAGLVLKGASLREIAQLRRTSETTIRQQAQGIYRKSGLAGRKELAAYFLESLFEERSGHQGRPSRQG